jgi:hypothetical protein
LKGVTVPGQPALTASAGELNQKPTWKVCIGAKAGLLAASTGWTVGAGPVLGATAKVSMLKRPITVTEAVPSLPDCRSLWYHDTPNGALGSWMMNRSNPVLGGSPAALMVIVSFWPCATTRTFAAALGRQFAVAATPDRTMVKLMVGLAA